MEDDKNIKANPGTQEEPGQKKADEQTDATDKNNNQDDALTEDELELAKKVRQAETERD